MKNYDSIFFGTKFNRCYSDNYGFVSIFPHNFDLLHYNIRHIEMIPVLGAFKKTASIFHSQYRNDTDSQQFKKYREYFPSAISVSDRFLFLKCICISFRPIFFMVLVVFKGSYISVSDRFLFKKWYYFDICIGFILFFSNGNYISLV